MTIQVSPSPVPNSNPVSLISTLLNKDTYLTGLLDEVTAATAADCFQELRQGAANWVRHSSIPTTREEEWRFTDLSALRQVQFHVETQLKSVDISALTLPEAVNSRLVFVNGVYAPDLSAVADLPSGVVVGNLADFSRSQQERVKQFLAQAEGSQEVFTALNTAGICDAAVVWVTKNVILETPIHLLFIAVAGEQATISQPRCLVVAETGGSVTVVEDFTNRTDAENEGVYLTNAVTEIWLGENAQVSHTRIEREGAEAFHVGKTAVTQARDSRYTCHALSFGGKLSRHNLEILQTGEQTETTLNGLTMISGRQVGDTHSAIALNHPHSTSTQLHKCIVGDRAHAVFNGKVFVPKAAQLTNAGQLNRNLLLSSKARVDTKPQLEITADNVKCAHGATVSQLEDDEIFYLQSRGINENEARKLLINAFAAEIINQIPVKSLQAVLFNTVNSLKSLTND
ncbi:MULTISPECIES: Fe-S cluster assembly protein SufD [unclassified Nodularia (in: cyanobacteria)]|uniref:Fe-S cluster assembly protein SufD n=1 Tax=unclassified Nodularia (in: cyanobacteria) TaxID=2656917 RepID=UPI00187EAB19|nr:MULTISPECIES: Fe-S cluster assembly protein SufD [unclassified Nodularia (in: cyanobacteria)]MBE9198599.1 Fe-S cluster assembly protein SufD [Nodularia sp. LEGE 06071]MCC2691832.1 Fe-S cluster assembly protein SufD [Nodularia sp. LEGE 04288]